MGGGDWAPADTPNGQRDRKRASEHEVSFRKAVKAGVKIAFGTDAGVYPHGDNAHEFELMVQAGMPPMFALQAATTHAAELLKHDKDIGSVTVGKFADLVAVAGNPVDDISQMKKVSFVMKEGVVYKSEGKTVDAIP